MQQEDNYFNVVPTIGQFEQPEQKQKTAPVAQEPTVTYKQPSQDHNALFSQAEKYQTSNQFDKAIECFENIIKNNPNHLEACFQLGNIYYNKSNLEKAAFYYEMASKSSKKSPQVHYNYGLCLRQMKKYNESIEQFEQTLKLAPNYSRATQQLARVYEEKKDHKNLIVTYNKLLKATPEDVSLHQSIGRSYKALDKFEKAVEHFRTAHYLRPKDLVTTLELANMLTMMNELDEALGLYHLGLLLDPTSTCALQNIAYVIKRKGFIKHTIELLKSLTEKHPSHAQSHFNLGLSLLTNGEWEEGWKEHEWRWQTESKPPQRLKEPMWDGSDLTGKTILLWAEQGLGDTFQFIRYAKRIKDLGATIVLQTQEALTDILSLVDYIDMVIPRGKTVPHYETHAPLMSLPLIFKTTQQNTPNSVPYLKADENLVELWNQKLSKDTNFKIGICWQGNAQYSTQFLRQVVAAKSMDVQLLRPIAKIPGVSLYSLQKVYGTDQLDDISFIVHDFGTDFDTKHGRFMDTAAIIKNLDLIITVDTSISHLAAALGAPTWILLPEPADWRWMTECTDTPWYPNIKLFRQPHVGDWKGAIEKVVKELKPLVENHKN